MEPNLEPQESDKITIDQEIQCMIVDLPPILNLRHDEIIELPPILVKKQDSIVELPPMAVTKDVNKVAILPSVLKTQDSVDK